MISLKPFVSTLTAFRDAYRPVLTQISLCLKLSMYNYHNAFIPGSTSSGDCQVVQGQVLGWCTSQSLPVARAGGKLPQGGASNQTILQDRGAGLIRRSGMDMHTVLILARILLLSYGHHASAHKVLSRYSMWSKCIKLVDRYNCPLCIIFALL